MSFADGSSPKRCRVAAFVTALALLAAVLVLALASAHAYADASRQVAPVKSWEFERFDVDIRINKDGSFTVRETQIVNFTGSFTFLNRDLTAGSAEFTGGRTYGRVRFNDIEVFNLEGRRYERAEVENIKGGKRVRIEFSAYNEQKGWIIEYRMKGALIYGPDHDRLYYNTVSYDRAVPIKSSRTTVTMPAGTDMNKVKTEVYPNQSNPPGSVSSGREGDTLWWEAKDIPPYTTVTIDVAFPKEIVQIPLTYRAWFGAVMIVLALLLALGSAIAMTWLWYLKGRDVKAPELDVVRYEPPADLRPAEVGVLVNEQPRTSDITATIVDLAIRRKLVINEQGGEGLLKKSEFVFQRWDSNVEDIAPFEQEIMAGLFESGETVTEDDLENKFYTHISEVNLSLKDQVLGKGFFEGDPAKVKGKYTRTAILLLLLIVPIFLVRAWIDPGYLYAFVPALAVSGIVVFIVGRFMPRRTAKGSEALSYVMGFKEYMATAEQEEMKFMTPENFQANLPYAMVLGVAREWAEKFKEIYTQPPDWYRGYYPGAFSTVYLADSLSRMQTSVGGTLVSSPSSSGGGGGFGGGSSGGGFGGGGSSAG